MGYDVFRAFNQSLRKGRLDAVDDTVTHFNCTVLTFNDPKIEAFWKHGKKEKMLVTSIFSFSNNVFYPSENKFQFFSHIWFVVCKCFQFGPL